MGNRIGGKEVAGVIIRKEGAIAEARESHRNSPRYVEQQLENIRRMNLATGVLAVDLQEAVALEFMDLTNISGDKLVSVAVGEAAIDSPEDELSVLVLRAAAGMGIAENRKVAMFSPLELDLRVAASLGMTRVRMGQERELGDDAGADNLSSFIALIDRD